MIGCILSFSEITIFLTAIIIFIILFVTIYKVLEGIAFFQGKATVIVAMCVSLLSVVSMYRFFVVSDGASKSSRNNDNLDLILLLYTALACTILSILFLSGIGKIFRGSGENKAVRKHKPEMEYRKHDQTTPPKELSKHAPLENQELSRKTRERQLR